MDKKEKQELLHKIIEIRKNLVEGIQHIDNLPDPDNEDHLLAALFGACYYAAKSLYLAGDFDAKEAQILLHRYNEAQQ